MLARRCGHMVALPIVVALVLWYFGFWYLAFVFVFASLFLAFFFRDPKRRIGREIVAAADGVIRDIQINEKHIMISTFMNVHNVHVNRMPLAGKILGLKRIKGGHKPAFGRAAHKNSRVVIVINTKIGRVKITQIAGIFAWRIVPYVRKGQSLKKGRKIGIIRFGSRVDVALPADKVKCAVKVGDKMKAGESTIAEVVR